MKLAQTSYGVHHLAMMKTLKRIVMMIETLKKQLENILELCDKVLLDDIKPNRLSDIQVREYEKGDDK